jgi:hypothetical protein
MSRVRRCIRLATLMGFVVCAALAQQPKAGVMGADEVKKGSQRLFLPWPVGSGTTA